MVNPGDRDEGVGAVRAGVGGFRADGYSGVGVDGGWYCSGGFLLTNAQGGAPVSGSGDGDALGGFDVRGRDEVAEDGDHGYRWSCVGDGEGHGKSGSFTITAQGVSPTSVTVMPRQSVTTDVFVGIADD
ncbi:MULTISPECIES: hypothetical protein [Bacteria]|uniref:hypothetical protein n=1 Tax=Bacteria TaxID=2 RepID=UPI003C797D0F